jgi:hypothetical protein
MKTKKQFVARNTLLDPDNVVPSWECGAVENKEISMRMREQRQEYDRVHRTVVAKERELEQMKKRLERQKDEEYYLEDSQGLKKYQIEVGGDELSQIKEAYDFEKMNQR